MNSTPTKNFFNQNAGNFGNEKVFDAKLNIILKPFGKNEQADTYHIDGVTLPPDLWGSKFWKTKENIRDLNTKNNGSPKSGRSQSVVKRVPTIQTDFASDKEGRSGMHALVDRKF